MYKTYAFTVMLFSATFATLTGCGDDDANSTKKTSPVDEITINNPLAGHYGTTTTMKGYKVTNEINIDPKGNFLGLAFNTLNSGQSSTVYTVLKGNTKTSPLYEFDLIESSINTYQATGQIQDNKNQILFNFDRIPVDLQRPRTLLVNRLVTKPFPMTLLVGSYNTKTLDLSGKFTSTTNINTTDTPSVLNLSYTDSRGCQLNGVIVKREYQNDFIDIEGALSGTRCVYAGQSFEGLVGYDYPTESIVIFGTTANNSNALVIVTQT